MARSNKFTDKINNATYEGNQSLTDIERDRLADFPGLGYYSRTSVEDIINNFIVSHIGEGKVLPKVPRHEVAFWAQRGLQEFSYDILYSEKNIEVELGPSLSIPLPSDYVNYVKIVAIDTYGNDRTIHPSRRTSSKKGILQDDNFNYIYDDTGEKTVADKSASTERFQDDNIVNTRNRNEREDSFSFLSDDIYDYYYAGYFGRRYGNDPQFENYNGAFQLDQEAGIIYFDSTLSEGDVVGLRYISDGLCNNDDLATAYVPKLAEDALYAFMMYNLTKVRSATAQLAPLYDKERKAKMRNAKIRLSNYKSEELAQVLRGKAKWIKH